MKKNASEIYNFLLFIVVIIIGLITALFFFSCAPNIQNQFPSTKLNHLRISEYPDTIRILSNKDNEFKTIGKYLNLGYRVKNEIFITTEPKAVFGRFSLLNMDYDYRYVTFIKIKNKDINSEPK
jgi:hypothetical protein